MERIYQKKPVEKYLFHGTHRIHVHSICQNNFDWRKHGASIGNCYGKGVNFSPISHYASYYCDKGNCQKVMLVAKVAICETCIGSENMSIPPVCGANGVRFDTSCKETGHVIVKYSDDEFYPAYKITFVINDLQNFYKKKQRRRY